MSLHPIRQYFRTHSREDEASAQPLGIKTMLGTASKLGRREVVRCFSRSLAGSCCDERPDGTTIATPVCRAACYHHQMINGRPTITERLRRNDIIARRDDFHLLLAGAIIDAGVQYFRMHDVGDFAAPRDIDNVRRAAGMLPNVHFWAYTRSWRFEEMIPGLMELHTLPNFDLLLSLDRKTGVPRGDLEELSSAWFADTDGDPPPIKCEIVFRGTVEKNPVVTDQRKQARATGIALPQIGRNVVEKRQLGRSPVCPHETGREIKKGYEDCVSCRICLVKIRRSNRYPEPRKE